MANIQVSAASAFSAMIGAEIAGGNVVSVKEYSGDEVESIATASVAAFGVSNREDVFMAALAFYALVHGASLKNIEHDKAVIIALNTAEDAAIKVRIGDFVDVVADALSVGFGDVVLGKLFRSTRVSKKFGNVYPNAIKATSDVTKVKSFLSQFVSRDATLRICGAGTVSYSKEVLGEASSGNGVDYTV